MRAGEIVKSPWLFGDRSVKEDVKSGVVLPKLKVEHPSSRLGDPDKITLRGTSRVESRFSESQRSTRSKPREDYQTACSNLPDIPDGVEVKFAEDRTKAHLPIFGNNHNVSGRIESRLASISSRSSRSSFGDRMTTSQLEKKLKEKMKNGYFSLKNLFKSYDPESRGKVNREQLIRVLSTFLAMKITLSQFNRLMKRLGLDENKFILFEEFYQLFKNKKEVENEYPTWFFQDNDDKGNNASKVHMYLKVEAAKSLENLLSNLDLIKDERIVKPEFRSRLKNIGYDMDPVEFEKLWKKYDESNTGSLEIEKLIKRLVDKPKHISAHGNDVNMNQSHREQSINIEKWLIKKFREGFHELQHAFKEVEVDGMVYRHHFIAILEEYGLFLTDDRLDLFLERCHVPCGGQLIDYKKFLMVFQNRNDKGLTSKILNDSDHRYHQDSAGMRSVITNISSIEAMLVDMFQTDFLKLLSKFQKIDHNRKGVISTIEFRAAIESFFGVKLCDADFAELMKAVPTDRSGDVKYQEFMSKFDSKISKSIFDYASSVGDNNYARPQTMNSTSSQKSYMLHESCHSSRQRSVSQLTTGIKWILKENFQNIEKIFHELDERNTKRMNKEILKKLLSRAGLQVTNDEIDALWEAILTDQRGALEFTQFIRHFGHSKSAAFPNSKTNPPLRGDDDFRVRSNKLNSSKSLVEDYVKNVLGKKYSEIWKAFCRIDKEGSGYVTDIQFKKLIGIHCPTLTEYEIFELSLNYLDSDRVAWKDFMRAHPQKVISRTSHHMSDIIMQSPRDQEENIGNNM